MCSETSFNCFGQPYDVPRQKVNCLRQLSEGDHICFHRSKTYWHHAIVEWIDVDDEEIHVIHYSNNRGISKESSSNCFEAGEIVFARVQEDKYFFPANTVYLMKHDPSKCYPPDEVVRRARNKLGDDNYNPITNNCEHFAMWCKTGYSTCDQVKTVGKEYEKRLAQEGCKIAGKLEVSKGVAETTTMSAMNFKLDVETIALSKKIQEDIANVMSMDFGTKAFSKTIQEDIVGTMSKEVGSKAFLNTAEEQMFGTMSKEFGVKAFSRTMQEEIVGTMTREVGTKTVLNTAQKEVLGTVSLDGSKYFFKSAEEQLFDLICKDVETKTVRSVGKEVSKKSVTQVAEKEIGKRAASGMSRVASEAAIGAAVAFASEAAFAAHDIYKAKKKLNKGEIKKEDFDNAVKKRVTTGTCNVVGSVAGSTIGQMLMPMLISTSPTFGVSVLGHTIGQVLIPVPVIGSAIGGIVVGTGAALLGNYLFN